MSLNTSRATKRANKATSTTLSSLIASSYELPSYTCQVKVVHAREIKKAERERIWSIFEANMHELYENSSMGWNPPAKRKELYDPLSRFILVHDADKQLLAYLMFRLEHEEGEDITYCYEVQVDASVQGKGLGKKMLGDLVKVSGEYEMEKIMLTALKANPRAMALYKSIGFSLDPSSPGFVEEGDEIDEDEAAVDYEILSKVIELDS